MIKYSKLKKKPRDFLAATGLTVDEFKKMLPFFEQAYQQVYPPDRTLKGKPRVRRQGGGAPAGLASFSERLLFSLVYHKTNPLQTMHALQFGLSQPQTHYWIHHLMPVLQQALRDAGHAPEREASRVADHPLLLERSGDASIDGTERPRQRPVNDEKQKAHYSGKKKRHTDKNLLLVNETTTKVVYLSPTTLGKTHDKKIADEVQIAYPKNAILDKDTGFQGYEPKGVLTRQPKKSPKAASSRLGRRS